MNRTPAWLGPADALLIGVITATVSVGCLLIIHRRE